MTRDIWVPCGLRGRVVPSYFILLSELHTVRCTCYNLHYKFLKLVPLQGIDTVRGELVELTLVGRIDQLKSVSVA